LNTAILLVLSCLITPAQVPAQPTTTVYVSKLGDGSDGTTWAKAYRTVQAALDAVPDDKGGHRIVIRPDTYMEDNLFPAQKGAAGAYNELVGDVDGKLGSGTTGRVVLDCGDPEKGFKSYDWWGNVKSYQKAWSPEHTAETFSAIGWDRWVLRNLYATGGDGGLFFDCTDKVEPFTVVVEDCVSIGRAFGGGVGNCLSRPDEPITYRRCTLWALDQWGDTSGAYVRVENQAMPDRPDVVFEDCTMVGPQCSLKGGNYGFKTYTRALARRCRLITLNFSQPQGEPTDGIVQSVQAGKHFHVDFEDCTLMGYKVFGVKVEKETVGELAYTTKGDCRAYVQFQQEVPKGFHQLTAWPVEAFDALLPPKPEIPRPEPTQGELVRRDLCEVTPIVWDGKLCLMTCVRPGSGGTKEDYWITLTDVASGAEMAHFAQGYSLACAMVNEGTLHVFASRFENNNWNDVTHFWSTDLKTWESKVAITQNPAEHLFNSSVCKGPDGFVMTYETNDPAWPAFTAKFARSTDLMNWTTESDALLGKDRYAACPCIRYSDGYYYVMYTEHRTPRWTFEVYIARSKDLKTWELSAANPVLAPGAIDDGIDASDLDLVDFEGKTYVYYAVGDQLTWMNIKRMVYPGTVDDYLKSWFTAPGVPTQ
jgi:hypothetical protein